MAMIRLWLDDVRKPPVGWTWARNYEEAVRLMTEHTVSEASLDHDLGCCRECQDANPNEELIRCDHVRTGYNFCLWMAEHDIWPLTLPVVHSMNPVGRQNMTAILNRYFHTTGTA